MDETYDGERDALVSIAAEAVEQVDADELERFAVEDAVLQAGRDLAYCDRGHPGRPSNQPCGPCEDEDAAMDARPFDDEPTCNYCGTDDGVEFYPFGDHASLPLCPSCARRSGRTVR